MIDDNTRDLIHDAILCGLKIDDRFKIIIESCDFTMISFTGASYDVFYSVTDKKTGDSYQDYVNCYDAIETGVFSGDIKNGLFIAPF